MSKDVTVMEAALEALVTGEGKEEAIRSIRTYLGHLTTHSHGCWSWGPHHYSCAINELDRLKRLQLRKDFE